VPVRDRAKFILDNLYQLGSRIMASDYSQYESHFTLEIMEVCEFQLYDYMTQNLPTGGAFRDVLRSIIGGRNHCTYKNVSVDINGTRMSGEMNTSLGNGFTNLMLILFTAYSHKWKNFRGVIEGDDGLFTYFGDEPTLGWFESLGFTIKLQHFDFLNEASFCGLVFDSVDMCVLADPIKLLLNVGWARANLLNASQKTLCKMLRAKCMSLYSSYPGCPVVSSFAFNILRLLGPGYVNTNDMNNYKRTMFYQDLIGFDFNKRPVVGFGSRIIVSKLFKISVQDQIILEEYFDSMCKIDNWTHPSLLGYCNKDQLHYSDVYVQDSYCHGNCPILRVPHKMTRKRQQKLKKQKQQQKPAVPVVRRPVVKRPNRTMATVMDNSSIGSKIGSALGGVLGHGAQQLVKYITGFGDYSLQENTLMTGGMSPPDVKNSVDTGGFIVRHREYIADILGTIAFTNTTFSINPGLEGSFPWLSQIAQSFEEYAIRGMIFEYKSMSASAAISASANTALGTVIMATQYNSLNNAFTDKKTMENYQFANSSKPNESFIHPIECKMNQTPLARMYTRDGTPTTGDLRFYDLGTFQIATQGQIVNGGVMGELWCSFEVELYKPKLVSSLGFNELTDHWIITSTTSAAPFSISALRALQPGSLLGTTILGNLVTFPSSISDGNFLVNYFDIGSSVTTVNPTVTFSNCSVLNVWNNDASAAANTAAGAVSTTYFTLFVIKVTASPASFIFGAAGTIPAGTADLWITQINSGIAT